MSATGNAHIDTLVGESFIWKNSDFALGTAVRVNFAFLTTRPQDWPESSFLGLGGAQPVSNAADYKTLILQSMDILEASCGVDFVETAPDAARITFGVASLGGSTAGYAQTYLNTTQQLYATQVIYDDSIFGNANTKMTITHEIAHALGLKHPGNYNTGDASPYLPGSEDNTLNTVMSYNVTSPDTLNPAPYDIEALQYLYGAAIRSGQRVGIASSELARLGTPDNELYALNSYTLWQQSPTSFTNHGAGFASSASMLTIDGGSGIDEVHVPLVRDAVALAQTGAGSWQLTTQYSVALSSSTGALALTDVVRNVERLRFADTKLALDLDGHAGKTARLLGAVFGRESVANATYAGIGLSLLDDGMAYSSLADLALQAAGISGNNALVTRLWTNVVGAAPSAEQMAPYISMLENGTSAAALTELAANTDLNAANIGLVGLSQSGLVYV